MWSSVGGAVLAWGIIAPSLIKTGVAVDYNYSDEFPELATSNLMVFKDMDLYITAPSPRYWLLWPGVFIMLVYSFADIFISLIPSFRAINISKEDLNPRSWFQRSVHEEDIDQTPLEDRVPHLWWIVGLIASTVSACAILATMFHMNVGTALLSLILGFVFSFIAVQSSGYTDINPVSTVAKASQLVFGGISKGSGMAPGPAQTMNLVSGVIAAGSAAQAVDMTGDLKTGYLLRAKPKNQFIAQCVGAVVAVFLSTGLFILFTKATPCILYVQSAFDICDFLLT